MEVSEENCNFCNPKLKLEYDLNIICKDYKTKVRKLLDQEVKNLLLKIFNTNKFFLPNELINIIFEYAEYNEINKISKINADSVLHFQNCKTCSIKVLKFYEEKLCFNHFLPSCALYDNI